MKRLYKSSTNKTLTGLCGGIGDYFNIDPVIIRILFLIFGFSGIGFIAYFIASMIVPREEEVREYNGYRDVNYKEL